MKEMDEKCNDVKNENKLLKGDLQKVFASQKLMAVEKNEMHLQMISENNELHLLMLS